MFLFQKNDKILHFFLKEIDLIALKIKVDEIKTLNCEPPYGWFHNDLKIRRSVK